MTNFMLIVINAIIFIGIIGIIILCKILSDSKEKNRTNFLFTLSNKSNYKYEIHQNDEFFLKWDYWNDGRKHLKNKRIRSISYKKKGISYWLCDEDEDIVNSSKGDVEEYNILYVRLPYEFKGFIEINKRYLKGVNAFKEWVIKRKGLYRFENDIDANFKKAFNIYSNNHELSKKICNCNMQKIILIYFDSNPNDFLIDIFDSKIFILSDRFYSQRKLYEFLKFGEDIAKTILHSLKNKNLPI